MEQLGASRQMEKQVPLELIHAEKWGEGRIALVM